MTDPLIPSFLNINLQLNDKNLQGLSLPYSHSEEAGILNTDICSFTRITEQVSSKGHYGVEVITGILNSYFGTMISCIHQNGGCLLKYGGDSMFAIFPGSSELAIPRMLQCRDAMYAGLAELNQSFVTKYNLRINFDGAIKYGRINLCVVGDPRYHLDYYVDGRAVKELFELGASAPDGQIVCGAEIEQWQDNPSTIFDCNNIEAQIAGDSFIPRQVKRKINEKGFSAELRNTAVIFVHISNQDASPQIEVQHYHDFYVKLQRNVYELDGTINKIDFTDKGYLVLITFGTPYNHTDDIERAFTCAFRIQRIHSDKISVKIGVTYSNIYAGILGAKERHEYGIIGNAVNVAARLMSNSAPGEISFSEDLLPNVASRFESIFVEETGVKGIHKPLRIHKIIGELPDSWFAMHSKYQSQSLVCYHEELNRVQSMILASESPYLIISGPAGTGKSFLAYRVMRKLKEQGLPMDLYVMEEYNQNKQCDWLQKVLAQKLLLLDLVQDFPLLEEYCSRLELGYDLGLIKRYFEAMQDSRVEVQKEEFEIIYDQLADIVTRLHGDSRLLFIDDIQWMDSSSYQVYTRSLPRLLSSGRATIVTNRNGTEVYTPLGFEKQQVHLRLDNLDLSNAQTIIKTEIPVISEDAVNAIFSMTKGNPLFMVEMTKVIRAYIDVSNNILAESDLKRLEKEGIISGTIENLLINEYENLDSEAQKMLKIASIIGKAFALDELNVVSQAHINSDYQEIIQSLSNSRIIGKKTFNPGIEYVFNNHLMRDAIYRTILMSEKRNLHEKIGQFYEEKYARNINPYLELIANHYIYAGAEVKALQYAILSGEKTARLAAYPESNYYYEKAISFCRDSLQGYHIRLAMIKNCVNQGDANTAWELISALEQSHSMHLSDDYYLQKVRILTLKGMNHDVVNYVPDILPLIQKSSFKDSIRLRYMDALNALNRLDEFMAEAEAMRIAVADSSDAKLKGDFYTTMALMHLNRSEYTKAAEYYQKLRAQAEHSQDQIHLRIAFSGLGVVASRQGDKAQARHYYELALAICERLGDRNGYSKAILDLGTLLRNEGEIDAAIQMYLKSLSTAEAIGNIVQQSTATYNIGEAYYYQDLFDEALEYMEKALALSDAIGDMLGKTFCYDAMGDIHFRKDELDEAEAIYNANLKLQHELKDNEGIAHSIGNLANIANTRGNFAAAEELYLKQAEILSEVGDLDGKGRAFYNRAMLYLNAGKKDAAIELLHEACMLFEQCKAQIFIDIVKDKLKEVQDSSEQ